MRAGVLSVALAALGLLLPLAPQHASAQRAASTPRLTSVPAVCTQCHTDTDSTTLRTLSHGRPGNSVSCLTCHHIGFTNDPKVETARRVEVCEACHADLPSSHVGVQDGAPTCTDCHSIHQDTAITAAGVAISTRCRSCHATKHLLHADAGANSPVCTDCHTIHTGRRFSATDRAGPNACVTCHQGAHPTHTDAGARFVCAECHKEGEPPGMAAADSATNEVCAACHTDVRPGLGHAEGSPATCVSCHDFRRDVRLADGGPEMSRRCASCHADAMAAFMASRHPDVMSDDPRTDLSNCLACHASHRTASASGAPLRVAATERCLQCHGLGGVAALGRSYEDDFHGATMKFLTAGPEGATYPAVMGCTDCHGTHQASMPARQAAEQVCARCHQAGDARLAGAWLGHRPIGPTNHPLIWAIRLSYFILIPFMLTGLLLNILFHLVDQRREGARLMETPAVRRLLAWAKREGGNRPGPETVERFSVTERLEHAASATTFILLVVTGLPQIRPDWRVARAIIDFLGGIGTTRVVHRSLGFTFIALLLVHVARIVARSLRSHRLPVMVPTRQDFLDVVQTFRHYLLGERRPRVGRFDFAEKFEYWGLFLGGTVMSTTGLLLVFPALASHLLPGVVLAAARVVHGFEATFAVSVVIVWHSYGVLFRPEVFPLDTSMFTGRISVERLREEHPLEYERLVAEGKVDGGTFIPDSLSLHAPDDNVNENL